MQSPPPVAMTRRRLLALGGSTAAALALAACSGEDPDPDTDGGAPCVDRDTLDRHSTLDGLPLVYEIGQQPSAFSFDAGFYAQLQTWLGAYRQTLGDRTADQVWTYGSWIDGTGTCDSWHHAGRAFDLSRVRLGRGRFVSARYDQWSTAAGATLDGRRREYWTLAASLHRHFAYVLTYLYDADHHNHLHVDNGVSGTQMSRFNSRSRVQVQAVQAICTYLWRQPVELSGRWDRATRRASRRVLDALGISDDLATGSASWQPFLQGSVDRGAS